MNAPRLRYHVIKFPEAKLLNEDEEIVIEQVEGFVYDILTYDWMYDGAGI